MDVFGCLTSVVFDVPSQLEIVSQKMTARSLAQSDREELEVITNLLFCSSCYLVQQAKSPSREKDTAPTFKQFWKIAQGALSLKALLDLTKKAKVHSNLTEPILRLQVLVLHFSDSLVSGDAAEIEEQLCLDFVKELRDLVSVPSSSPEVVKLSITNLFRLGDLFPAQKTQVVEVLSELIQGQIDLLKS